MSRRSSIVAGLAVLALVSIARADAPPPSAAGAAVEPRFGDQGLAISGGTSLQLTSSSFSGSLARSTNARFALGLDLFTGKGFSIRLDLLLSLPCSWEVWRRLSGRRLRGWKRAQAVVSHTV